MSGDRVTPVPLLPGDVVAVVAPSGPLDPARLAAGVARLSAWGLRVEVMPHALDRAHEGMLAGTDEARSADLQRAWTAPDVRAVFCGRGGYGASRLLGGLDWPQLRAARPKWLVGSSDATALHEAFGLRLGVVTVYGPMAASELFATVGEDDPSVRSLRQVLFDGIQTVALQGRGPAIAPGTAQGTVVGGNLALLASSIGTADTIPAHGAIGFLEDVGEAPYRVDRLLTQLLRSGWFAGVRGLALGSFVDCGDVLPVLLDRLAGLQVPVARGFAVGHGPRQLSLPLGARARLDADRSTLTFEPVAGHL